MLLNGKKIDNNEYLERLESTKELVYKIGCTETHISI